MTTAKTYQEVLGTLRADGHEQIDIDAAIESLIDSGITYADEDELYLTDDEIGVLRDQLSGTEEQTTKTLPETRATYDRLRRAAGIPSVSSETVRPDGLRDEAWILAKPGRLAAARTFAMNARMLPAGGDGWAAPGAQIEFEMTRRAIEDYLRGLDDPSGEPEPARGPGRPPIGPLVNVTMPQEMIDALDEIAERDGVSRAEVVRRMVGQALDPSLRIMTFVGWRSADGEITDEDEVYGYDEGEYWDESGRYRGPDKHGVEPLYELRVI